MNDLTILVLTVGEKFVLDAIENIRARTDHFDLVCVYDTCGLPVDWDLYRQLPQDTILVRNNRGICGAMNMVMMTCYSEFLVFTPADALLKKGWWDKIKDVFDRDPQMAFVGDNPSIGEHVTAINDPNYQADNTICFRMKAVEDVGGILRSFRMYGSEITEWPRRARTKGWNFASVGGVNENNPMTLHEGREKVNRPDMIDHDCRVLLQAEKLGYSGYSWMEKELPG